MDADELELTCACRYENFDRIVVQRRPQPPIVTDFVACNTMYWAPGGPSSPPQLSSVRMSIGPPPAEASFAGLKNLGWRTRDYREHEPSPEELEDIEKAAARANKRKR